MVGSGISSYGSIALLVSSMTGPGLSTIPALFQQAGWAAPVFIIIIIACLSVCSALFVCEALSSIKGNERFQAKIELTTIAQVYLGKRYHYLFQLLLYLSLQSVNVSSIILASQTFDSMFITLFKGTCGLAIYPGGWVCVADHHLEGNAPFPSDQYFIFTFGFLFTAVMVIPLGFYSIVENIIIQMTSFIVLIAILIQWTVAFAQEGMNPQLLPASGSNLSMVLGIVIFNFSFITTIPSWVNSLREDVNIHRCLWISIIISTLFYIVLGVCGAMTYRMDSSSDILNILNSQGSTISKVTSYLFPLCALVTSIPVFTIVIKSNLLRGEICSTSWASFWSNFLPWIICLPLQTKSWVGLIQNWSSLFFQSTVNFIIPFILYFVSRRYIVSVEMLNQSADQKPIYQNEKENNPIGIQLAFPPSIDSHHYDDNDVRMFDPDGNYSISIRRSSIRPSKCSQIEHAPSITTPRFLLEQSSEISHTQDNVVPAIVYNDNTVDEECTPGHGSLHTLRSNMTRRKENGNHHSSHSAPPSPLLNKPRSVVGRVNSYNDSEATYNHLSTPMAAIHIVESIHINDHLMPQNQSHQRHTTSIDMSQISSIHISSLIAPHLSSIATSHPHSLKSFTPIPQSFLDDTSKIDYNDTQKPFAAFPTHDCFNSFYLAIFSCVILVTSIVFMIIYYLILLGMGKSVF
ncbi:hypothetical protein BDB01DRAFT_902473 [Pilobolus umbonatus]|nr:hypothetical protein BDB01DRAFT_902473 [Pilobolus umbonatus]